MPKLLELWRFVEWIFFRDLGAPRLSSRQDEPLGRHNAVVAGDLWSKIHCQIWSNGLFVNGCRANIVEGLWAPPFQFSVLLNLCNFLDSL